MRVRFPLSFALCAALALPGTGFAAIELYGQVHVSLDAVDNGDGTVDVGTEADPATAEVKDMSFLVSSNKSRVGLRGRHGVRDRTSVVWQFENEVDLDDGGWGDGRDSFVGLETRFGTFLAGRHVTPYRELTDRLDIFADTRADHSAVLGAVNGESLFNQRARNTVYYASPRDRRIRFAGAWITNLDRDVMPRAEDTDRDGFSAALVFDSGPLYLGAAYESLDFEPGDPARSRGKAAKFAFGWDFGQGTRVALIHEQADSGVRSGVLEEARDAWHASIAHVAGNFTWKLAWGMMDETDDAPDSGAQMVALGFDYALAPTTTLYLLSTAVLNDDAARYGLQPDHDDEGSDLAPAAPGNNVVAVSAGLIHRFDIGL